MGLVLYVPFVRWRMHPGFMSEYFFKKDIKNLNLIIYLFHFNRQSHHLLSNAVRSGSNKSHGDV
jgi:hypothetical protein